ncbi:hypothetical protein SAMN06265219_11133 [Gracilimonas mengyeensis]|uniref:Cohesin domain-containing protein n=2 Tax=Gracilimonas mengyeensis TaxID=1302730 RepID=A0A521EBN1_9BACT|nr:hypothetical protein SAMN06265219_11133 [Gracilimonas mengyeensis]
MTFRRMAMCALLVAMVSACDFSALSDAADDFVVLIGLEPINTYATVQITDAASGELVDADVTASFTGQNGEDVIDMYSDPIQSQNVEEGILGFGINNGITPSEGAPAEVQVWFRAKGYLPASKMVRITQEGDSDFGVKLTKKNNAPQGINSTSAKTSTGSDNATMQELNIEAASDDQESSTTLSIPAGLVFKDADGNDLQGELNVEVVNFDPGTTESLSALPYYPEAENANETSRVLAMAVMEVTDASGRQAASIGGGAGTSSKAQSGGAYFGTCTQNNSPISFTPPASIAFNVFAGTFNPNESVIFTVSGVGGLGATLAKSVGQSIVGECTINPQTGVISGYFSGTGSILGFHQNVTSTTTATININRNGWAGPVKGKVYNNGILKEFNIAAGSNSTQINSLAAESFTVEITEPVFAKIENHSFANNPTAEIFLLSAPSNMVDETTMNFTLACPDNSQKVRITNLKASLNYRKTGANGPWRTTSPTFIFSEEEKALTGGSFLAYNMEPNQEYTFTTTYDGKAIKIHEVFETNKVYNFEIPASSADICD